MPLCPSGAMSLGGTDAPRSVNCELGCSGTAAICMDATAVRTLAGRPGAGCAICMQDFYGKSSVPAVGGEYQGGYYFGAVSSPANYYIIIAPNATGCACCRWKTTRTTSASTNSPTDGYANTYDGLASAIHPAGNFTATRSINGFSDWYLPSSSEYVLLYNNRNSAPAGQGFGGPYWTSTERTTASACYIRFLNGNFSYSQMCYLRDVRAIRRRAF